MPPPHPAAYGDGPDTRTKGAPGGDSVVAGGVFDEEPDEEDAFEPPPQPAMSDKQTINVSGRMHLASVRVATGQPPAGGRFGDDSSHVAYNNYPLAPET
jgi:hypothetical protein